MIKPTIMNNKLMFMRRKILFILDGLSNLSRVSLALSLPLLFAISSQRSSYGCFSSYHRVSWFYDHRNIALVLNRRLGLTLKRRSNRFYSTSSPINLYDNYENITSEVINKLLINQQVSISQAELDKLKSIPGVKFDLPLNDETFRAFIGLLGRSNSRVNRAGIYIFTHLESSKKYIGSSNSLARRLFGYFRHEHNQKENSGLMLPILKQEGIAAFSLEIFIIPTEFPSDSYLFLEQYHLLNKQFDLNTQRTVQFRALRPHKIYLYDL